MKKINKTESANKEFLNRIKPVLMSWGLCQHPNPRSYFGRSDHGYRYDFADMRDEANIRLATFGIINPNASLWIVAYKYEELNSKSSDVPILFGDIDGIFKLTRKWSIKRPFDLSYKIKKNSAEEVNKLFEDILFDINRMNKYLYG